MHKRLVDVVVVLALNNDKFRKDTLMIEVILLAFAAFVGSFFINDEE